MTALLLERGATPDDDESLYHSSRAATTRACCCCWTPTRACDGTNALGHMLDYDDLEGLRLLLDRGVAQQGAEWPELQGMIEAALARDRSRAHIELLLAHGARSPSATPRWPSRRGRADLLDLLGPASPSLRRAARRAATRRSPGRGCRPRRQSGLLERLDRAIATCSLHAAAGGRLDAARPMLEIGLPVDMELCDVHFLLVHLYQLVVRRFRLWMFI